MRERPIIPSVVFVRDENLTMSMAPPRACIINNQTRIVDKLHKKNKNWLNRFIY